MVKTKFTNKYDKSVSPDEMTPQEKKFFYDYLEKVVDKNDNLTRVEGGLEKTLASLTIITFFSSIFFLFPSLTGNIIGNLSSKTLSFIGIVLFLLSLIGGFILIKKKQNK
jgi:hypothetical protein